MNENTNHPESTRRLSADEAELTEQEKVVALFRFIKELNKLKQRSVLNVKDHLWFFSLADIPDDPDNISVFYRDRVEDEDYNLSSLLLSVHKPEFQRCPEPDSSFAEWLEPGWDSYKLNASVRETLSDEEEQIELSLESDRSLQTRSRTWRYLQKEQDNICYCFGSSHRIGDVTSWHYNGC